MKITVVIGPYLPVPAIMGGAVEKRSLAIAEQLAARGHQVTMISRRHPDLPDGNIQNGVTHIRVPSRNAPPNRLVYLLHDIRYALRAIRAMPKSDVSVTNSISLPLLMPKKKAGKIVVDVGRYPKGQMGFYRRVSRLRVGTRAMEAAIAAQSPSMSDRILVLPNCLSDTYARAAAEATDKVREKEILYVGRIAREKGIDLLVQAFSEVADRHPDWKLTVVGPWDATLGGDGEALLASLKSLAPADARIEYVGPVFDEGALRARYEAAGIFVYPSVAEQGEAFGVAPLEAMACGCPTIVSGLKVFRDFVTDGDNGLVFDHRDKGGARLAALLDRLMGDAAERERLSAAGRNAALRYTPERVAEDYERAFSAI